MEGLLSVTINYQEYCHIKNQLSGLSLENQEINVRDKVIFELAWIGLAKDEIKNIKESDIMFQENEDTGLDEALIQINEKLIKIDDPDVVDDIKKVINEEYYYIYSKDGREKKMQYRSSEYLLKPINVGRNKFETNLNNPSLVMQSQFKSGNVTCDRIDIENLTLEDVRRSKIIYMLAEENAEFFDMDLISVLFDLKNESGLYWLKKIAREKYK
jgi:putative cell wall-binding protein